MAKHERSVDIAASLAPFNRRLLLTGAGFSRNWGGYLSSELWSLVLGNPKIRTRPKIDRLLHREMNFEAALAEVEVTDRATYTGRDREILREAVMDAFEVQDTRIRSWDDGDGDLTSGLRGLVK